MTTKITETMPVRPLKGHEDHDLKPMLDFKADLLSVDTNNVLDVQECTRLGRQAQSQSGRMVVVQQDPEDPLKLVCAFKEGISRLEAHAHMVFKEIVKLIAHILAQRPNTATA